MGSLLKMHHAHTTDIFSQKTLLNLSLGATYNLEQGLTLLIARFRQGLGSTQILQTLV